MELTKSEKEIADRYLSKREKQLAQWPYKRWLILVIFSAMALVGYHYASDGMRSINDDRDTDAQVDRAVGEDPPPGLERRWVVGTMLKISKILEARYQVVTYSFMEVAVGYVQILGGVVMVVLTILHWKPSARDALICRLLRAKLQELQPDVAPNRRPPSQSPAAPEVQSSDSQRTTSSRSSG